MKRFYLIVILMIWSALEVHGSDIGVRAQSFGGAFRAVATSNEIIFSNPAGLLKKRRLGIESDYQLSFYDKSSRLSLSIADSKTSSWGMGFAYSANFRDKSKTSHSGYLSMAMPLGTDMIILGGSFSYLYEPSMPNYQHFFNSDVALMINTPVGLSFALVLDHLVNPKGQEKPLGLAFAAALDLSRVSELPLILSIDWLMNDAKSNIDLKHMVAFGGEFVLLSLIPIRAGFQSVLHEKLISVGSGVNLPSVSFDIVFQQNLSRPEDRHLGLALRLDI